MEAQGSQEAALGCPTFLPHALKGEKQLAHREGWPDANAPVGMGWGNLDT